jgi:FkbM family methyltransferase
VIDRFLGNTPSGFYVDVGAHHPERFSNTYAFYLRGWRGINIDAMPGSMTAFRRTRPRDINLETGVAEQAGELTYYMFNEPALNGFSAALTEERTRIMTGGKPAYQVIGRRSVPCVPLRDILGVHAAGTPIDFLSIDVEGLDLQVLRSNDWAIYRPRLVLVECIELREALLDIADSDIGKFMLEHAYVPVAKTFNTVFFKDATGP